MWGEKDLYTVMFIGHRYISHQNYVYKRIKETVYGLLGVYGSLEILIGNDGDFDTLAASAVQKIKKETEKDINLILVLPYTKKDIEYFEKYYDEVEICAESSTAHFKAAIGIRNKCTVDRSDTIIMVMVSRNISVSTQNL